MTYPYQHQDPSPTSTNIENLAMFHVSIPELPQRTSESRNGSSVPLTRRTRPQSFLQRPSSSPFQPQSVILLIFLPIPPLLSLLYLATGHAILRQAHISSPSSIYHSPIVTSIEAGATGGLIISLPSFFFLYLLIFYHSRHSVPDDFFDDDDGSATTHNWTLYLGYLACLFFAVGIGGIAGPLGVICLANGVLNPFIVAKKMLSTGAAVAAGFLGGFVLSLSVLLLALFISWGWSFWKRRKFYLLS